MFDMFNLSEEDHADVTKVLQEFQTRCLSVSKIIYNCHFLNKGIQEGSKSLDHYIMKVMKHAELCKNGNLMNELICAGQSMTSKKIDYVRNCLCRRKDLYRTIESHRNPEN